ncbi:hypothetical protein [Luteolibacter sp. AS25]|uniref:hypothetical protein n=1 Tax=Luteolibacter sp. AS25 TaxID=3135776 RepID=UPI00398B6CEF
MKIIILAFIVAASISRAAILADGSGFFPILVQVIDSISGTPVAGAEVRLDDLREYTETELDPERQTKVLPETLGKTITTNTEGVAVVFYHGRFSTTTINGKTTHLRSMAATIVVEHDGKENYRSTLAEWAKANGFVVDESPVPREHSDLDAFDTSYV